MFGAIFHLFMEDSSPVWAMANELWMEQMTKNCQDMQQDGGPYIDRVFPWVLAVKSSLGNEVCPGVGKGLCHSYVFWPP